MNAFQKLVAAAALIAVFVPTSNASAQQHDYTIRLASAHVRNTRSRANDTIHASLSVYVNGKRVRRTIWDGRGFNGRNDEGRDWNNGDHFFSNRSGSVTQVRTGMISPGDRVSIVFEVVNSGSYPNDAGYDRASDAIVQSNCKGDKEQQSGWGCILATVGQIFTGWIFTNCDGPIAADEIVMTGAQLAASMVDQAEGKPHGGFSKDYKGRDSPAGCGSNSDYRIDFAIFRER